jgi:hypothetical protein
MRHEDEEPTRLLAPAGEPLPQQRSAADEETMVFTPNGGDRTDDDRPGIDRVTGDSAHVAEPTSASGYERDPDASDEPTAVGLAAVDTAEADRAEPDADATVVQPPTGDTSPTVYESSTAPARADDEVVDVVDEDRGEAEYSAVDDDRTEREADYLAEDEAPAGAVAPEPVAAAAAPAADLRPGDAPAAPVETLWGDGRSQEYRERWREVQLLFVDEPRAAAEQAESLVNDVVDAFTAALGTQREALAAWQSADKHDTEELRMAVRRYREFLNRLLDL